MRAASKNGGTRGAIGGTKGELGAEIAPEKAVNRWYLASKVGFGCFKKLQGDLEEDMDLTPPALELQHVLP